MPRNDGRIEPGQRLNGAISARAWNRMLDAADLVLGVQTGVEAMPPATHGSPYTWFYVKNGNNNGQTIPRWGTVLFGEWAQTSSLVVPTDGVSGEGTKMFEDTPVLVGRTPGRGPARADAFGIAVEPIQGGAVGRVAVSGVIQCKVRTNDAEIGHVPYAVPDFDTGYLRSSAYSTEYGGATILHVDLQPHQNGLSWALVRLDSPQSIRRGVIRSTWTNGTEKQVFEVPPSGVVTLANGEKRQGFGSTSGVATDGGPVVFQGEFTAWNYLATLQLPVTSTINGQSSTIEGRWVYCAKVGRQWHLIAYETLRTSGQAVKDSGSAAIFI